MRASENPNYYKASCLIPVAGMVEKKKENALLQEKIQVAEENKTSTSAKNTTSIESCTRCKVIVECVNPKEKLNRM